MFSSQSNSQQDDDSRMHRIINDAKFAVEELQRRHRQNETDMDNLDKELEKMLLDGEAIEREEQLLSDQTSHFSEETARMTSLCQGAEKERFNLEEMLRKKREELEVFHQKAEEETRAHDQLVAEVKEKFAQSIESWENVSYIRELRQVEMKRDEDRAKLDEFRNGDKADIIRNMERADQVEMRMEQFQSESSAWVRAAEKWMEYRSKREHIENKRRELEKLKGEAVKRKAEEEVERRRKEQDARRMQHELERRRKEQDARRMQQELERKRKEQDGRRMQQEVEGRQQEQEARRTRQEVERRREQESLRVDRERKEEEAKKLRDMLQNRQPCKNKSKTPSSNSSKSRDKNRCNENKRQPKNLTASRGSPPASSPPPAAAMSYGAPPTSGVFLSPPRNNGVNAEEGARRSSTMMKTPQLNIPTFLRKNAVSEADPASSPPPHSSAAPSSPKLAMNSPTPSPPPQNSPPPRNPPSPPPSYARGHHLSAQNPSAFRGGAFPPPAPPSAASSRQNSMAPTNRHSPSSTFGPASYSVSAGVPSTSLQPPEMSATTEDTHFGREAEPEGGDSFFLDASAEDGSPWQQQQQDGSRQLDSNFPSFEDLSFNMDSNKEGEPGRQQPEFGTFDVGSSKEGDGQQFLFGALCGAGDSAGGDDFSFDL